MNIAQVFNKHAKNYDVDRKRLIPCHDDFYNTGLEIIPFNKDQNLLVLDLGAGTGLYSLWVASLFPKAELTLIDISPAMLDVARQNFPGKDAGRILFQVSDYVKEDLETGYDLIISSLSIHHLSDDDKRKIFRKSHKALKPGGFFVNADQVLGESPLAEEIFQETWLRKVRENGISEKALAASLERMKEDRLSPLSSQITWLKEAGFCEVTTWYQNYSLVVYSGTKPLT